jgi:hypothetical protein
VGCFYRQFLGYLCVPWQSLGPKGLPTEARQADIILVFLDGTTCRSLVSSVVGSQRPPKRHSTSQPAFTSVEAGVVIFDSQTASPKISTRGTKRALKVGRRGKSSACATSPQGQALAVSGKKSRTPMRSTWWQPNAISCDAQGHSTANSRRFLKLTVLTTRSPSSLNSGTAP